jgi:acyl-CoA reductase-like NAD-dependent aldehyde dehydrogenase
LEVAEAGGARVLVDGRSAEGPEGGFWFGATVLDIDDVQGPLAREEVFGPVLTIETYSDEASSAERDAAATAVARTSSLGLSAAVWSADPDRAERVGAGLRTGQVRINGARWDYRLPFGGFASAGWGREWGQAGIEAFTTTRTIVR